MFRRDKTPKPVDIWLPDYYKTPVKELYGPELTFDIDPKTAESASKQVNRVFRRGIEVHDPNGIMATYGQMPTVRVCNHHSRTDPPVLDLALQNAGARLSYFAAMAELFDKRRPRRAKKIAKLGGFPVDRARMAAGELPTVVRFMKASKFILEQLQESIVIFPQAGITRAGKAGIVEDINDGAIMVAERSHVPIIVCGIAGNSRALAKSLIGRARATVLVHEVFDADELPTTDELQGSMQIALQRAWQHHQG